MALSFATPTSTTIQGATISAPNATIVDDTPNALLSRVVAKVLAKGLHVVGVYGGDWEATREAGRTRQYEVDVACTVDGEPIGQVLVRHSRVAGFYKVRGIAFNPVHHHQMVDRTQVGFMGAQVPALLGWRE